MIAECVQIEGAFRAASEPAHALTCSSPAEGVRGGRHKWAADHTSSSFKGGEESGSGGGKGYEREMVRARGRDGRECIYPSEMCLRSGLGQVRGGGR